MRGSIQRKNTGFCQGYLGICCYLMCLSFTEVACKTGFYRTISKYSDKVGKGTALFNMTSEETPTRGACALNCFSMENCESFVYGSGVCLGYTKFTDHTSTLPISGVQHFDDEGPSGNLAVKKATGQSSYYTWKGMKLQAWRAVEGNRRATISDTSAYCFATHPFYTKNANMHLDLEKTYFIESFSILLRKGQNKFGLYVRSTAKVIYGREKQRKKEKPATQFKDVSIRVGQTLQTVSQCAYVTTTPSSQQGKFINVSCNKSGRFVKVVQATGVLRFCEIEVYGYLA